MSLQPRFTHKGGRRSGVCYHPNGPRDCQGGFGVTPSRFVITLFHPWGFALRIRGAPYGPPRDKMSGGAPGETCVLSAGRFINGVRQSALQSNFVAVVSETSLFPPWTSVRRMGMLDINLVAPGKVRFGGRGLRSGGSKGFPAALCGFGNMPRMGWIALSRFPRTRHAALRANFLFAPDNSAAPIGWAKTNTDGNAAERRRSARTRIDGCAGQCA